MCESCGRSMERHGDAVPNGVDCVDGAAMLGRRNYYLLLSSRQMIRMATILRAFLGCCVISRSGIVVL